MFMLCRSLCEEDYRCFRSIVIDIVLATDMARHHGLVQEFAGELQLWGPDLSRWPADKRTLALQVDFFFLCWRYWVGGGIGTGA